MKTIDIMETIELGGLGDQARQVLKELTEVILLKSGQILVAGCSSSEIDSFKIGSHSSAEIGVAMYTALYQELKSEGTYLAAQYCGHSDCALILEVEAAQTHGYEPVNVAPQLKAGGSFITAVYATLEHSVVVGHIRAHVGIDMGDTLIGIHMKDVAVPVRIKTKRIGSAYVVCAKTRPKFIGDIRARYNEEDTQGPQPVADIGYEDRI